MSDTETQHDEPIHAGPCPECGQMVQYVDKNGEVEYREIQLPWKKHAHELLRAAKQAKLCLEAEWSKSRQEESTAYSNLNDALAKIQFDDE